MQHLQCTFDKPQSLKPAMHDSQTHIGFQEIGFLKKNWCSNHTTQLNYLLIVNTASQNIFGHSYWICWFSFRNALISSARLSLCRCSLQSSLERQSANECRI